MKQNTNQIFKAEDLDWKELEKNGKNGKNGKNVSDLKSKKEEYGGKKTPDQIMEYINEYLPEDIVVLEVSEVPLRFHSRLNAVKKTYCYRIFLGEKPDVFRRKYVTPVAENLNINKMKAAAEVLLGTHDFTSFCGNRHFKKSAVRTIYEIRIEEKKDELDISFTGNGFLQNMVRILTGTLLEVGTGKREVREMKEILEGRNRSLAGPVAAAKGLVLINVEYE